MFSLSKKLCVILYKSYLYFVNDCEKTIYYLKRNAFTSSLGSNEENLKRFRGSAYLQSLRNWFRWWTYMYSQYSTNLGYPNAYTPWEICWGFLELVTYPQVVSLVIFMNQSLIKFNWFSFYFEIWWIKSRETWTKRMWGIIRNIKNSSCSSRFNFRLKVGINNTNPLKFYVFYFSLSSNNNIGNQGSISILKSLISLPHLKKLTLNLL